MSRPLIPETKLVPERGILQSLKPSEVQAVCEASQNGVSDLMRRCLIAVLNTGSDHDDPAVLMQEFRQFDFRLLPDQNQLNVNLYNVPSNCAAFEDGEILQGTREHVYSVVRDIAFWHPDALGGKVDQPVEDMIYDVMKHADLIDIDSDRPMITFWGGHSVKGYEYDYSKLLGYYVGRKKGDVCTGCGPGIMKGPMKGALLGHAKQRIYNGIYAGLTEPGIIAAEAPNAIVNKLNILRNIEERLEGFLRRTDALASLPGGVGTVEETFYALSVLLHPDNKGIPLKIIFTAPKEEMEYFKILDRFIVKVLGEEARNKYEIVIGDARGAAFKLIEQAEVMQKFKKNTGDHRNYNWSLTIPEFLRKEFKPTHANAKGLDFSSQQDAYMLSANISKLFSLIVAGNVKPDAVKLVKELGEFEMFLPKNLKDDIEELLNSFIEQGRMKIGGGYKPSYILHEK